MGPFKDGWLKEDVQKVIDENNSEDLLYVPIVITMDPLDFDWAENICVTLSEYPDFNVRGNAILGFSHLARVCGKLNENIVRPVIERALNDENEYVKGHAQDAVEDIMHYLEWNFEFK